MQVMLTAKSNIVLYTEGAVIVVGGLINISCFVDQQSWSTHHDQLIFTHTGQSLSLRRNMIAQHC